MKITKKQRLEVWNKSGGICWYCGDDLPEKGWHVDHCEPIYRYPDGSYKQANHTIKNMVPSCKTCNLFKSVFSVEEFRTELELQLERARKYSVNFRMAEKYELVKPAKTRVAFWFETHQPAQTTAHEGE